MSDVVDRPEGDDVTVRSTHEELSGNVARLKDEKHSPPAGNPQERQMQGQLLAILDSLDAGVYVADMQTHEVLYVNSYTRKLFGDVTGRICWQALHADQSGPCPFCTNDKLLDSAGNPLGTYCWEHQNSRTGRWFYLQDKAIEWFDGHLVRLEIATDITARVETEESLRSSEMQYRSLFEAAQDGFFIMGLDGRIIEVNPSCCRMHGYSREELITLNPLAVIHPDFHKFFPEMLRDLNRGKPFAMEGCHVRKDGSFMDADVHLSPFFYEGKPHIFGVIRDISEQKKVAREQARLETQLRQSQKMEAIGTLAGGIAHDFNNILTAIMGYTDLAIHLLPKDGQVYDHLHAVSRASHRAKELVKQILAFSRNADSEHIAIRISSVVKEVIKLLRASLPATIEIRQEISNETGLILADPTQIHQVLLNLCTNAADAMEESGGVMEISLGNEMRSFAEKGEAYEGEFVRLSISDTGKGIDPAIQERIFEPFFTTKEKGRGTGMGLAVVHGIVKNHKGMISMKSTPEEGTVFTLYFPVIRAGESVKSMEPEPPASGAGRILLVDDEEPVALMEEKILASRGYTVTSTTSSKEAVALFQENPLGFDLVITDQTMPQMTGIELIKKIKKIRDDIPVILCSGYSTAVNEKSAQETGAFAFLMKPFDSKLLVSVVSRALAGQDRAGKAAAPGRLPDGP